MPQVRYRTGFRRDDSLLNLFVERYPLQIRVVLLALNTSGRVLTIFGRNVPRCAGNVGFLLFCAL